MNGDQARSIVGDWLRFRMENDPRLQPGGGAGGWGDYCGLQPEQLRRVFGQLIADAMHSSLLARMLDGEQPKPPFEYEAFRQGKP
jgi:hypothetical protein